MLTTARTEFEAETWANALRAENVDARVFGVVGTVLAAYGPALGQPIQLIVPRRDAERAAMILARVREDSVDIDWRELDPGEETAQELLTATAQRAAFMRRLAFGLALGAVAFAVVDLLVLEGEIAPSVTIPLGMLGVAYIGAALAVGTFGRRVAR